MSIKTFLKKNMGDIQLITILMGSIFIIHKMTEHLTEKQVT